MTEQAIPHAVPTGIASAIPRLTLTVSEAAQALGIGETLARELIRTGQLPVLRLGRRVLIARAAIERLLETGEMGPPADI